MNSTRSGVVCLASKSAHELDPRFVQVCCMIWNFCSHFHISGNQFKTSTFFVFLVTKLMTIALSPSKITFEWPWLQQFIVAPSKACSSQRKVVDGILFTKKLFVRFSKWFSLFSIMCPKLLSWIKENVTYKLHNLFSYFWRCTYFLIFTDMWKYIYYLEPKKIVLHNYTVIFLYINNVKIILLIYRIINL